MKPGVKSHSEAIIAGILLEGILLVASLLWAWFSKTNFPLSPTTLDFSRGVLLALPLLMVNAVLFTAPLSRFPRLKEIHEFQQEFILPLAKHFNWLSALVISITAGLGEEFFFRGMIQPNLGIVFASLLFALLHFGSAVRKYKLTAVIYVLIGLYFGISYAQTGSIWTVVICHSVYDFTALVYLRYFRHAYNS